ncbi:hypothetical protein HPB48_019876 [Haemaphysalis longicornis]|uniref:Major facilitator superfamily (MFS) profile domain-containing protein n=1 Tax=Haemaphysalis longicornis TaxID=44386 RepID=A0A9J6FZ70_HAELO|nr:hypothetical protein HPB48_019876 [Haemaphysalis longicornis]
MVGLTAVLCDRLGRKPLLLFSSLGTCASLGVLGLSFHLKATAGATFTDSFGWLPLAALCSYIIVYSMGLGPLPWVLLGEMIPLKVKGFATGICTAMLFGEGFVVAKTYNELTAAIGTAATYWMYSASLALGFILTLLFVPETKGRDLDEIEYLFGKPKSPSRCSPV